MRTPEENGIIQPVFFLEHMRQRFEEIYMREKVERKGRVPNEKEKKES